MMVKHQKLNQYLIWFLFFCFSDSILFPEDKRDRLNIQNLPFAYMILVSLPFGLSLLSSIKWNSRIKSWKQKSFVLFFADTFSVSTTKNPENWFLSLFFGIFTFHYLCVSWWLIFICWLLLDLLLFTNNPEYK
jgi:hypothetical protein